MIHSDDPRAPTSGEPIEVTAAEQLERLTRESDRLFLLFRAGWSDTCRAAEEPVIAVADDSDCQLGVVDVERCPGIAHRFEIDRLPTVVLFQEGEPAGRIVGIPEPDRLTELACR